MSKLKIAIIGMGRMGLTHYAIINSHPDVEIDSVSDSSALMLTMLRKHLPVKTFKDYTEMLKQTKPDAVLVCTPPILNYEIIQETAGRDIPVFVEKPFTTHLSYASELASIYIDKKLTNQVGYVNRFNDVFIKAKEFITNNIIGKIIRFKSEMFSYTITKTSESSDWRSSRKTGGGAIFEMASHAIDLVNFLIGKPDKMVGSSLSYIYSTKVEDAVYSTFLYKKGITGILNINWCDSSFRKPTNKMEIFGESGRILADQYSLKIFLNKNNEQLNLMQGWNTLYITDIFTPVPFYVRGNEFTRQLYHFVDCVQNKIVNTNCSFTDGVNTLKVIEDIFNDFEENGRI
jgi:predicted dehydrogenase